MLPNPLPAGMDPRTTANFAKAKACWAGGALQIYLNVIGRDPDPRPSNARNAVPRRRRTPNPNFMADPRVPADQVDARSSTRSRTRSSRSTDPNDWNHDGNPDNLKMIDRVFTKAEARYIPIGGGQTADMAHPTRTGDLIVFAYPPYQYDAETPGTLVAPSHFFGQHGYVPDVQNLAANINMRATFLAGGTGVAKGQVDARSIDLAPTLAFILGIPEPQHSQGKVLLDVVKGGNGYKPISIVGLNDFHGQLDPATLVGDNGISSTVGGASFLATMFDEEFASLGQSGLLLAAGDNVGASPPNSGLLEDMPAIDVENLWGLDATSLGNHEFDYGVERLLEHIDRADFPFLATNVVEESTGELPDWLDAVEGVHRQRHQGRRHRRRARVDARARLRRRDRGPRRSSPKARGSRPSPSGSRRSASTSRSSSSTRGPRSAPNPIGQTPGVAWEGPILDIADQLQDTTVDAMIVGHTHRVSNLMRGHILITEGINAGTSYSVLQLMVKDGDVAWAGGATRVAKTLGVARRADVQAVVAAANAEVAADPPAGRRGPGVRHLPRSDPAPRVGDGQPRRRRDARQVRRRGRGGVHELGRPPGRPPVRPAERRRGLVRDHARGAVRRPAVRQRDRRRDADRRPDADGVHQRVLAVLQLGDRAPAASRRSRACKRHVPLQRHQPSSSTASGRRPEGHRRCRCADRTTTPSGS